MNLAILVNYLIMDSSLKPEHQAELQKYLQFFKLKRDESIKEASIAVEQCKDQSLRDEVYSKTDVEEVINALGEEMKRTLESEL